MNSMLDFSCANLSTRSVNTQINQLIESTEPPSKNFRQYLGASAVGSECLRSIQYGWMCDPVHPVRTKDIFDRGHHFEGVMRQHLVDAGFKFASKERLAFAALDGLFRGHADGIIVAAPSGILNYPCLWEHKCLNAKGWEAIERDGLTGLYRVYAAQTAVYQHHLHVTDHPALFSVMNANTCERLHFLVPFDAALAQAMSDRAVRIIEATKAGELLPRISENPDNWRCKACQWRARCWGDGHGSAR